MLGKLIKHEFRASGRTMLPFLGAVLALAVLAGISARMIDTDRDYGLLQVLFGLFIFLFVMGIIAVCVVAFVVMIQRFHKNLLNDEGYISFTLPVTADEHIFSKLIVSFIWFLATGVVLMIAVLVMTLTTVPGAIGWEDFRGIFGPDGVLNASRIWEVFSVWDIVGYVLEGILTLFIISCGMCLHFYAAMAIGYSFANRKALLSVVFYFVLSAVMSVLQNIAISVTGNTGIFEALSSINMSNVSTSAAVHIAMLVICGAGLLEAALYYIPTTLCLRKRLNLA